MRDPSIFSIILLLHALHREGSSQMTPPRLCLIKGAGVLGSRGGANIGSMS